jgi:hypothetical protein
MSKKNNSSTSLKNLRSAKKSTKTARFEPYKMHESLINQSNFDENLTMQKSGRSSNSIFDRIKEGTSLLRRSRKISKKEKLKDLKVPLFQSSKNEKKRFFDKRNQRLQTFLKSEYVVSASSDEEQKFQSNTNPNLKLKEVKTASKNINKFSDLNEEKRDFPRFKNHQTNYNIFVNAIVNNDSFREKDKTDNSFPNLLLESFRNPNRHSFMMPSAKNDNDLPKLDLFNTKMETSHGQIHPFQMHFKDSTNAFPMSNSKIQNNPFQVLNNNYFEKSQEQQIYQPSEKSEIYPLSASFSKEGSAFYSSGFNSKNRRKETLKLGDLEENLYGLRDEPCIKEVCFNDPDPEIEAFDNIFLKDKKLNFGTFSKKKEEFDLNPSRKNDKGIFKSEQRKVNKKYIEDVRKVKTEGRTPWNVKNNFIDNVAKADDFNFNENPKKEEKMILSNKKNNQGFNYINYINNTFDFNSDCEELKNRKWWKISQRVYETKENEKYNGAKELNYLKFYTGNKNSIAFDKKFLKNKDKNMMEYFLVYISEELNNKKPIYKMKKKELFDPILKKLSQNKLLSHLNTIDIIKDDMDILEGFVFLSGLLGIVDKEEFNNFVQGFKSFKHSEMVTENIDQLMNDDVFKMLRKSNMHPENFKQFLNEIMSKNSVKNLEPKSGTSETKEVQLSFLNEKKLSVGNCRYISINSLFNFTDHEAILNAEKVQKVYICKYCDKLFKSGCALGGHISKKHKGLSKNYYNNKKNGKYLKIEKARNKILK